ncbi:Crp/Fnr family transcriptional regulator [Candidatus Saccharibacteria bacterium]|nr:Crp/Fnr family transcriptional regulator [Candidatus Saccharibacteria bacterium]
MKTNIIRELFGGSILRKLPKKQIVLYEGDPIENLYYIVNGYVKVYNILGNGTERTIFIYGPGDIFPFTSYLTGSGLARYFYECMTEVEMCVASPENVEAKVRGNFELGDALIHYTNSVSQQFLSRIDILAVNDARRKVIALLAFLVDKTSDGDGQSRITIPLTTQDIANMCGLTRETTSVQLSRLRKSGILSGSRNLVVNMAKLEKLKPRLAISH